jgi:uncharacterized protein RhaS with RHS repeats
MYDPKIGQFLTEDPSGFDGLDENLRRYVRNQVTTLTDPTGLAPPLTWNPDDPTSLVPGPLPDAPSTHFASLVRHYSRGGDDRERDYETARIRVELELRQEFPYSNDCDAVYAVVLHYRADLRGQLDSRAVGRNYGLWNRRGRQFVRLRVEPPRGTPGLNNYGSLTASIELGTIRRGEAISGTLHIASFDTEQRVRPGRIAEEIAYLVRVPCDGEVRMDLEVGELPTGVGMFDQPLRDLLNEPPYPPYVPD